MIFPAQLGDNVKCETVKPVEAASKGQPSLLVSWKKPWNALHVPKYGIWVHQTFHEYFTSDTKMLLDDVCSRASEDKEIHVWIRSYYYTSSDASTFDDEHLVHGDWGKKIVCSCTVTN